MSANLNARTAAIEALIEAHATELKLPTVRRRFRALAAEATREQQTPVAYLAALLEAETAERRERRRLIDARFPALKRLDEFRIADNPKIPQATIAALAEGSWITDASPSAPLTSSSWRSSRCSRADGPCCAPASSAATPGLHEALAPLRDRCLKHLLRRAASATVASPRSTLRTIRCFSWTLNIGGTSHRLLLDRDLRTRSK